MIASDWQDAQGVDVGFQQDIGHIDFAIKQQIHQACFVFRIGANIKRAQYRWTCHIDVYEEHGVI